MLGINWEKNAVHAELNALQNNTTLKIGYGETVKPLPGPDLGSVDL